MLAVGTVAGRAEEPGRIEDVESDVVGAGTDGRTGATASDRTGGVMRNSTRGAAATCEVVGATTGGSTVGVVDAATRGIASNAVGEITEDTMGARERRGERAAWRRNWHRRSRW